MRRANASKTTRLRQAKTNLRQHTFPKKLISLIPVLSAIPFAASVTDASHRYLYVNKAFERTYGHTLATLAGCSPGILWPHGKGANGNLLEHLQTATRNGGWSGQLVNVTRQGELLHIDLRTLPLVIWPDETQTTMTPVTGSPPPSPAPTLPDIYFLGVACGRDDREKRDTIMFKLLFDRLIAQSATLAKATHAPEAALLAGQTKRRQEIYHLMRQGLNYKTIAATLNISVATVRVVVADLRKHLGEAYVPRLRQQ